MARAPPRNTRAPPMAGAPHTLRTTGLSQVLQSAIWTIGAGQHVSLRPPPIPLVYNTANLIGVDPSMRIPLCTIL